MTYKDKFLREGVSVEEFANTLTEDIIYPPSAEDIIEFLNKTITHTLTEDEKVKEMVYTKEHKREVLATGYYFGLLYYVLNLGTHPTAYVKIPKDNWLCSVRYYDDIPIECHGGITFRDDHLHITDNQKIEGEFIGWDYAHCTDYAPYYDEVLSKDTHKWTTKEILEEVKEVCSQIVELGKKPHLTEDERVILKHISHDFKYICRFNDLLYFNCQKGTPYMESVFGYSTFQFIKERRRIRDSEIVRR